MKTPNIPSMIAVLLALMAAPVHASTTLVPTLTISEEYTDNVDSVATNKKEEFITLVSPGVSINIEARRQQARLSYSPGFAFHLRDADNNSVRHNADARYTAQLTRETELTLSDRYVRTEEPRTTGADAEASTWIDPTLRQGRRTWSSNTASADLKYRFGKDDSIGIGYRHSILENEDPTLEDNQRHSPYARILAYWFSPSIGMDLDLSYEQGLFEELTDNLKQYKGTIKAIHRINPHLKWFLRYTHTETIYDGLTPDYTIYDPGLGLTWTIAEDTILDIDVGYFWQDRAGSDQESGLSFKGDLAKTWKIKNGSFRLSGESGYEEASYGAESLGLDIYYAVKGHAAYDVTREVSLTADGTYRYNKYVNTIPQRQDDVYDGAIGIRYRPAALRWLTFSLTGRRHDVASTDGANDITENSVMFSISLSPVTPYRFD